MTEATRYTVVMNEEEQYSIWPALRAVPDGWSEAGPTGSKEECLRFIDENWHDMRPRSARPVEGSSA